MSEVVGGTSADFGVDNEWTDVDEQESGAVEGFEEWGAALPTKTVEPNDYHEDGKNVPGGDNWSWGAAWSAFTTAVQQDVKEIAGSVKNSVNHLREELRPDEKPTQMPGEIPEQDEKDLSEGSDKELDAGLGAIDQQVDQIASAAGKALGSLWTGIGGAITSTAQAASSVAGQLEQAAMQATHSNGRRASPWSSRSFGGRSEGPWVLPRDGVHEDEWQVLDLLGSPATSVAASFDQLFKLYRGHRFSEELEALGNEASRSCNRVRTQLPEMQRSELDTIIARTAAYVDLLATMAPTQDAHSAARALVHDIPSSAQHLEKGELPLAHRGGPREGLASMCAASVDRAVHMRDSLSTESPQKAWEGLCRVRAEGLKLLAEFTALSIQHMSFLAMCLEGGDAEAAGLQFLPDGSNKGAVVRGVLLQLLSDTDAIFEAFYTALEQATEDEEFAAMLLDQPTDDGSEAAADELGIAQQQSSLSEVSGGGTRDASLQPNMALVVGELKGGLLVGVKSAVERIMQGSRNLVYPICAPAAVRLDAETGLSPIPDIGQQPYEHVNPEPSSDPDADGSGPMVRHRTTSLSNPLFEQAGAVSSQMSSHDPMQAVMQHEQADLPAVTAELQEPPVAAVVQPSEGSIAEATSPLTGVRDSTDVVASPPVVEEEDSLVQVQPPRLGSEAPAASAQETSEQSTPQVPELKDTDGAAEPASSVVVDTTESKDAVEPASSVVVDTTESKDAVEPASSVVVDTTESNDAVEPASSVVVDTTDSKDAVEPASSVVVDTTESKDAVEPASSVVVDTTEHAAVECTVGTAEKDDAVIADVVEPKAEAEVPEAPEDVKVDDEPTTEQRSVGKSTVAQGENETAAEDGASREATAKADEDLATVVAEEAPEDKEPAVVAAQEDDPAAAAEEL